MLGPAVKSKQSNESVRYTDEGINVVALDRKGRGLHRAHPERRHPSSRHGPVPSRSSSVLPVVVVLVVAAAVVGVLLASG